MGFFDHHEDTYNEYSERRETEHKASLSHELIAGAAAFEAAKAYENHRAENGHPESHAFGKELLAGFAGAFIDREFETKGLDYIDERRDREKAKEKAREYIDESYTEEVYYDRDRYRD